MPSSDGATPGTTACENTCKRDAPVRVSASTGPMSMSSMTSAKSRPSMPIECTASASAPGNGPKPTAVTNSSAQMRSGTARVSAIVPRAAAYKMRDGVTLRAAKIANGNAINIPTIVPKSAVSNVSSVGHAILLKSPAFGGSERRRMSAMPPMPVMRSCGRAFTTTSACAKSTTKATTARVTRQT
jgi:hypothetical protein